VLVVEQNISDEVRALKQAVILADAEQKTREAMIADERRLFAQFQSRNALELSALGQREDAESQIAALRIQSSERLRQIALDETDETVKANKLRLEREETEKRIAALRTQQLLDRSAAIRAGVSAGVNTDTSALQAQFGAEADAELARKIKTLEVAKQQAEVNGLDATFLERRIEGLRAEAEAERDVAAAMIARVEATGQLASGFADLSTKIADTLALGIGSKEAYVAMGDAIGVAAGLGGALAQGLGVSAKTAAKVQAAFNAAAAIGAFGAYAASGFAAPNFLTASIQYGIAAAKFGIIAGVSSGAGAGRSGGGGAGSAGGGGFSAPTFNAAAERDKTAQAFAKALRDTMERPVQQIINIDMSRATILEKNPKVAADIYKSVEGVSVYQSGKRG
jgi:hypothetical protein